MSHPTSPFKLHHETLILNTKLTHLFTSNHQTTNSHHFSSFKAQTQILTNCLETNLFIRFDTQTLIHYQPIIMACSLQATLAANTCAFSTTSRFSMKHQRTSYRSSYSFTVRASSDDPDCNEEECAPDKEVGKVSVEWLAGEKTKVVGTYPPRRKQGWTGYVEKDTAGQTNIYSVEPVVYVAESAISSGSAGSSSDGAENTAAIAAGLALISIAAASSILLQVGKNPPQIQTAEYSGPSLSYYINKFKPPVVETTQSPATSETTESASAEITQASVTSETESSSTVQPESTPQVQVESQIQLETSSVNTVS